MRVALKKPQIRCSMQNRKGLFPAEYSCMLQKENTGNYTWCSSVNHFYHHHRRCPKRLALVLMCLLCALCGISHRRIDVLHQMRKSEMPFWNFQPKFVFQQYTAYGTFHKGWICLTTSVSRTECLSLPDTADTEFPILLRPLLQNHLNLRTPEA